ncbi:MAG: hypothetical protein N2482_01770 [Patescibacteria group bacterium]|nr:hypothetical protein [Patescibacteria group bacterium]
MKILVLKSSGRIRFMVLAGSAQPFVLSVKSKWMSIFPKINSKKIYQKGLFQVVLVGTEVVTIDFKYVNQRKIKKNFKRAIFSLQKSSPRFFTVLFKTTLKFTLFLLPFFLQLFI